MDEQWTGQDTPDAGRAPAATTMVPREMPEPIERRRHLVARWQAAVRTAKVHWTSAFQRMREDARFVRGHQWGSEHQDRYVANVVLRHVKQRTATLYAKNPRTVYRRRPRLASARWDGSLQTAQAATMAAAQAVQTGQMIDPNVQALLMDVEQTTRQTQMIERVGQTLQMLYEYQLSEQVHPFKLMMKLTVRRALTVGVGYVKLGFQRAMQRRPDVEAKIADFSERLSTVERLSADLADEKVQMDSSEAEELRLAIQALEQEPMILIREGLTFDFPDSWTIIPDTKCRQLREFLGCEWVAQEYFLTPEEVQEIYDVDVRQGARRYGQAMALPSDSTAAFTPMQHGQSSDQSFVCVWELWHRKTGLVYHMCDGWPDFLREPGPPEIKTERFWPWYPYVLNETYAEDEIFPPSDVTLLRDPQMEINRARQGLREHRRANRPKIVTPAGMLDDEDKSKLARHPANAIIELKALAPGQSVDQVLQPMKQTGVDPNLYDTSQAFEDILRVGGAQEANLGGTGEATATESSIAEASRQTASASEIDDLDDLLTQLARDGGQILLAEMNPETVQKIVGPGAVWPDLDREQIAAEIYLEVAAGSTGRPNKAADVQNFQTLAPIIMQIPGVNPEAFAKEAIRRLDDRLELSDFIQPGLPSIQAMNRQTQTTAAGPGKDPNQQGGEGADNAAQPAEPGRGPRPAETALGSSGPPQAAPMG